MLWREPYTPRVFTNIRLPHPSSTRVVLGAFDLRAQGELGVWWRLLQSAGLLGDTSVLLVTTPHETEGLQSVFPPSWRERLLIVDDANREWQRLVEPDKPERSFAAVVRDGSAEILVVGPPTEETWERFEALALTP